MFDARLRISAELSDSHGHSTGQTDWFGRVWSVWSLEFGVWSLESGQSGCPASAAKGGDGPSTSGSTVLA